MTTSAGRLADRMVALVADRVPFVAATVVRAQCPTSTRPGDAAVVLADGTIEGFVGGQCASASVQAAAKEVLETGEALLLRILPDGEETFPTSPGARTVVNPCLSGGAIEVFLEPRVPAPILSIVGMTPIAEAMATLAASLGFDAVRDADGPASPIGATAVVVASHGRLEESSIRAALDAGVGFVGLVASRTRGAAVLDSLGLTSAERARVRTPVGVDIGARTAGEIALSILAEVVQAVRLEGLVAPPVAGPQEIAPPATIDPVCGMTVDPVPGAPHLVVDGHTIWFCGPGCRERFAASAGGS